MPAIKSYGDVEHYAKSGPLYFYGGPLSSFARFDFRAPWWGDEGGDEFYWSTREHWYQAHKPPVEDVEACEWIRTAFDPNEAKKRGNHRTHFKLRPDWEEIKYPIMVEGIQLQTERYGFRNILHRTGDRPIAEASPTDDIWGILSGPDLFTGMNLLGIAHMETRYRLRYPGDGAHPRGRCRVQAFEQCVNAWPQMNISGAVKALGL